MRGLCDSDEITRSHQTVTLAGLPMMGEHRPLHQHIITKGVTNAPAHCSWSCLVDAEVRHEGQRANLLSDGVLPLLPESRTSLRKMLPTVS